MEVVYLIVLVAALILRRVMVPWRLQRTQRMQIQLIDHLMRHKTPPLCTSFGRLLGAIESLADRSVARALLLNPARKRARSLFWRRREQAARALALCAEERPLLALLDDSKWQVRLTAAALLVRMRSQRGRARIEKKIEQASGYTRGMYRDLLRQGGV